MERFILYQRSDIHKPTGKVKQNNTPRKKEQIKGNKDQGADNATEVSKQKDELVISCQKLTADEDVITKETDNNVNCLEQYGPPAKRIKREEIGDMLKVIYNKRLDDEETVHLTRAMINSGITLRWPADWIVFEKHSTDGVGDKVSLVLAPVLAACGLKVCMLRAVRRKA
ncbi:thymidine phosphorylase-like [Ruditapes philippinarum]|uniref:thymidine phosphorylase-like n=1 Tax=Ruditapes philippinarum TaxID=129788 RepID=UPI00295C04CF|nr:thymidine phosphorylase-like [Ruditapes philippinarum]